MPIILSIEVESIIFDVDQTLVPENETIVRKEIEKIIFNLSSKYKICLLSNFKRNEYGIKRMIKISKQLGVKFINSSYKKPSKYAFQEALNYLKTDKSKTLMVGDRLLTDIIGANNFGIKSVLVYPIKPSSDQILVRIARFMEFKYWGIIKSTIK